MPSPNTTANPFVKVIAMLGGVVVLVLGFMFSMVLISFIVLIGFAAWAYFWWKTRDLRKAMKAQRASQPMNAGNEAGGEIIEGEVIVVNDYVGDYAANGRPPIKDERVTGRSN
jgi:hypothetical protein